ncbi:MAG TPA: hypothetical protein PLI62_00290 [Spirochaetota bacterium]|nr:hypothetical protein [Spirochaetota bacterium]
MLEIIISFLGYLAGHLGDYYAGHWDFFHHWIYGIVFLILGIIYYEIPIFYYSIFFGIGLIISDLKDLFALKIFGPDEKTERNFWGID